MKVRCLSRQPTPEQMRRLGFDRRQRNEFAVTPGRVYTVLGLTFIAKSGFFGSGVTLQIIDDLDRWSLKPLCIFDIEDPRPSGLWIAGMLDDTDMGLWPESFFREGYHEDLVAGVDEVVADFERVRQALEAEFD